ncbi:hypothetical protein, partial [Flavobacterium terrae]
SKKKLRLPTINKAFYFSYSNFYNVATKLAYNVPALGEVAKYGTDYFRLNYKFLAKRERDFTTKLAISPNACYAGVV